MRKFIRYLAASVLSIGIASIYADALRPLNVQQIILFFAMVASGPLIVASFKESTS